MISAADQADLKQKLPELIADLYARGYRTFLCGGALGFDTLAAQAVLACKTACPDIRLKMALPCRSQSSAWAEADRQVYWEILRQADEVCWISENYYPGCMLMRNRYLVAHASYCVCFLKDRRGGTAYTVALAWRNGLEIRNMALLEEPAVQDINPDGC